MICLVGSPSPCPGRPRAGSTWAKLVLGARGGARQATSAPKSAEKRIQKISPYGLAARLSDSTRHLIGAFHEIIPTAAMRMPEISDLALTGLGPANMSCPYRGRLVSWERHAVGLPSITTGVTPKKSQQGPLVPVHQNYCRHQRIFHTASWLA